MPLSDIVLTEGSWSTHEPDEWYPGELVRIEEAGDFGYGPTLRFVMALDGEEGETWALTSTKFSPRTKLYGWVKAIDPQAIGEVGKAPAWEKLDGSRVEVMFEAGEDRERVSKIRAERKAAGKLKQNQKTAAAAKKPQGDDSPF